MQHNSFHRGQAFPYLKARVPAVARGYPEYLVRPEAACVDAKNDPINNNEERQHSDKLGIGTATDQIGSK